MTRKSIFITGAASGIGRETALLFAQKNWYTGLVDIDQTALEALAATIGEKNCFYRAADVTDADAVAAAMAAFAERTGGTMDVLLNNAGMIAFGGFDTVALEKSQQVVDVNFKGSLNCIYHAVGYLKKAAGARIINMSSASALYGIPALSVYSATKHALSAITEALDVEFEKYGIKVCDIQPPYVKTPLLDSPEPVHNIEKMGVRLEPAAVAETIWRATGRDKLHWKMADTRAVALLHWLPWGFRRFLLKKLTISSKNQSVRAEKTVPEGK
ncbi:MAG: SDR family oxidoreductase [Thermodesulfobacteriota bacterium]